MADVDWIGEYLFMNVLENVRAGFVEVELPDRTIRAFGDRSAALKARVTVRDVNAFRRILMSADIGFSEAFMADEVRVDDLTALLKILILDRDRMGNLDSRLAFLGLLID